MPRCIGAATIATLLLYMRLDRVVKLTGYKALV